MKRKPAKQDPHFMLAIIAVWVASSLVLALYATLSNPGFNILGTLHNFASAQTLPVARN